MRIRIYSKKDAKELYEITRDAEMKRYKGCIDIKSLNDTYKVIGWLEKAYINNSFPMLAIEENGKLVGNISMKIENNTIILGYFIGIKYQNKGLATKAVNEMLRRYKGRYAIKAFVINDNTASKKVLEKSGFKQIEHKIVDGFNQITYINSNDT